MNPVLAPSNAPASEERVVLYRNLFGLARSGGSDLLRFWIDPLGQLPFRLGESLAEAKVPYAFDDAFDRLASQAVADLLEILRRRFSPGDEGAEVETRRLIKEESLSPRFTGAGSLEHALAARAPQLDPHLDCGIVDSWTSRGGPGARLLSGIHEVLARGLEAEIEARGEIPYAYLVTLALADLLEEKKALAKSVNIRGLSYERLEKAVGLSLFAAVEVAATAALAPHRRRKTAVDLARTAGLVQSALNPLLYISIKSRALQNDLNPWALSPETVPTLEAVYGEVLQQDPDPPTLERRLWEAVSRSPEALRAAARAGLRRESRRRIFAFLAAFDDGRSDWLRLLASVVRRDADLGAAFGRTRAREALRARVAGLGRRGADEAGQRAHHELLELFDAHGEGDPVERGARGMPEPEGLARMGVASFLAYTLDQFAAARLEEVRGHLHHVRAAVASPSALVEGWEAGRLYRLSSDGKPFLKAMRRPMQGQLFVDLKGFTRRTHRAKEVVMADFMREQFYVPILAAAKRRFSSLAWGGAGDRPIELHNLLGDAAAFAGSVEDLLALARDLQRIGREYEQRLRVAAPSLADDRGLVSVEAGHAAADAEDARDLEALTLEHEMLKGEIARKTALPLAGKDRLLAAMFEERFLELDRLRRRTRERLAGGEDRSALEGYLERLSQWEAELRWKERRTREALAHLSEAERDPRLTELLVRKEKARIHEIAGRVDELTTARALRSRELEERRRQVVGFGLETGIYLSYGASAEVISLDDEVYGSLRVAISEKINEAARGTARSSEIKSKMDAQLEALRRERGRPDLSWPFEVYVESALSLMLPQAVSAAFEAALQGRDREAAGRAAALLARYAREDLEASIGSAGHDGARMIQSFSDIHNLGVALSGEALEAFLAESLAQRYHFKKVLAVAELHPEFHSHFAFREASLLFVISVPAEAGEKAKDQALVLRHAGQVQFRGFELKAAGAVYELVSPAGRFHQLLAYHHLDSWIEEARDDPGRLITSLSAAA